MVKEAHTGIFSGTFAVSEPIDATTNKVSDLKRKGGERKKRRRSENGMTIAREAKL